MKRASKKVVRQGIKEQKIGKRLAEGKAPKLREGIKDTYYKKNKKGLKVLIKAC